ncbi:uncharacterized protein mslnb isoform X2 [Danio rerio]|uniref:Uncharacterized protein mslnb isoform X2 n=1 Tax=Danio rerio TaxID=7955 RepID=A0AC58G457_DANRE
MKTAPLLLLLYAGAFAISSALQISDGQTCRARAGLTAEQCTMDGPTQSFLSCAGVPPEPTAEHMQNLKELISAALDIYSFMRSSVSGVPVLDVSGGFSVEEDLGIRAWLDIKLTPLLSSISRNLLTCLSNRNFSCSTYQTVVQELSQHFSSLDPVRQKWIYSFFMYPFLSRNTSSGCVDPEASTEDWLMKNFGSFSVMAQVKDFSSINLLFSGLEVLHLLSPEQKAELLLYPEVMGLTNSSLGLVFQSLMSSVMPSGNPWPSNNGTTLYMSPSSAQDPLGQAMNDFMTAFRPVGSFVKQFVSLTRQPNLSSMRSATLVQAIMNLTLAEMAAPFKQSYTQQQQQDPVAFDPMNVHDWYTHVVSPILRRFLPQEQIEIYPNLTTVFHNLFYIETGTGSGAQNETQDICSVFIDNRTCGLTDLVEHVATVLHCASGSNLTLNEETLSNVLLHLSQNLDALLQQLSTTNFSSQSSPFSDIVGQISADAFPISNLQDEAFVELWFQVKLKPLLNMLTPEYLACLSYKEFSCQTFQILVSGLSHDRLLMSDEGAQNVYQYFISSFLSHQNASGGCPAENSSVWIILNLGDFSHFATLSEMYQLNQAFNAIDALPVLSPNQTAELIVETFAGLPEKSVVITTVFDYLLISPEDRGLLEILQYLIVLADEMGLECASYQQIIQRLQESVFPTNMMQTIKDDMNQLKTIAPEECFPPHVMCISTPINETSICDGISSNETLLSAALASAPCQVNLQQYACSSLTGLTAEDLADLLTCQLSGNSSYSTEIWKLLFTKADHLLDRALAIFSSAAANTSQPISSDALSNALDVVWELRLQSVSDDQWRNASVISTLFSQTLKPLLPSASPSLLQCASSRNLTCQTYQLILTDFPLVSETQGTNMVEFFILPFLRSNTTDAGCVSSANSSSEWLQRNFGSFSKFVSLSVLLSINGKFSPLESLVDLSPGQMADLMAEGLPGLPQSVVITTLFDYLLVSPEERGLPAVLQDLLLISGKVSVPCSSYTLIFERLFQALPSLSTNMETLVYHTTEELKQTGARGCPLPPLPTCLFTPLNVTSVCSGVVSNETLLSAALTSAPCQVNLQQYACSSLTGLTAEDLADLLTCQLSGNSSYSTEIWKLLFTKADHLLDRALAIFSSAAANTSQPISSDALSNALDVVWELRLQSVSDDQWRNASVISTLFSQTLKPLLPSASPSLLQCASSRNLTCQTYQLILTDFPLVSETQGTNMVEFFILPFLRSNTTDAGCVSSANSSSEWLQRNFGSFSKFVSLSVLLSINGKFSPLESLVDLSPGQMADLMAEGLPGLPQSVVITTLFDYLLVSPEERGLPAVLQDLLLISGKVSVPCSSYTLIFERLFQALPSLSTNMATLVYHTTEELKQTGARGCPLPPLPTCLFTPLNVTSVCSGVVSNETLLSAALASAPCQVNLQQYACSSLTGLTAEDLADLLTCQLSGNSSYSTEIWKLLFTKADHLLDRALAIFSSAAANTSQPISSDALSNALDVVWELRLQSVSDDQWRNASVISTLFSQTLKPLLPSASPSLLQCASSRNLTCQTYQLILTDFPLVSETQGTNMVEFFILPFLRSNTTDAGCVSSANSSSEWLQRNFGSFSKFVSLSVLLSINGKFSPLESLVDLSPGQMADLMAEGLPGLPQSVVITTLFDYLLVSPEERGLPAVLQDLLLISGKVSVPCSSYTLIFERLFQALPSLSTNMATLVYHTTEELKQTGARGCPLPPLPTCLFTPLNVTSVCSGVVSNETLLSAALASAPCQVNLQQYACSSLTGLTAEDLADLLTCQLSGNSSYSTEIWKLLFTKADHLLDRALAIFSSAAANTSQPISSDALSNALDVVWELRLQSVSDDQWRNASVISTLFSQTLKPLLPSASPSLLQCASSRNLTCQTYQLILTDFPLVSETQGTNMVEFFILPFLRSNTTDAGCVSSANSSSEWLQRNFGSFSKFVSLSVLLSINGKFSPLESLVDLSPGQMADLMAEGLPGLPQSVVITTLFDYLLVSPEERGLPAVLQDLLLISGKSPLSCSADQLIVARLNQFLRSGAGSLEPVVWRSVNDLILNAPAGCTLFPVENECPVTLYNETQVCSAVNSSALQQLLNNRNTTTGLCDFSVTQYACTPVLLSVDQLVSVLSCHLSDAVSSTPDSWKLLLTGASDLLNVALQILSDRSLWWSSSSASVALDVLRELRLDRLSDDGVVWWLSERLQPFLPSASETFLRCLSSKNYSCQNFQTMVKTFSAGYLHMNDPQRQMTLTALILPLLSRGTAGVACVSSNSSQWLIGNFGQFSALVSLKQIFALNPQFDPLSALPYLSPDQLVELMFADIPGLPEKAVVIPAVFDQLTLQPNMIVSTLAIMVQSLVTSNVSCATNQLIVHRLDHLMLGVSVDLEMVVLKSQAAVLQSAPQGCVNSSGQCGVTTVNETAVCQSVNSSAVSLYLSSPHDGSQLCKFSITQYACAQLAALSPQDLATVLSCILSGNKSASNETWKLFTQKVTPVLGPALDLLANTRLNKSLPLESFLNMIGEVTLSSFSSSELRDGSFVQRWFNSRLRPFLPYASETFLSCLSTRDFSCDTFRILVQSFSQSFGFMSSDTQASVCLDFIQFFLSRKTVAGCVNVSESSSDWLISSFGRFSDLIPISDLQTINPSFSVMDTLGLLSIKQLAEISSTPGLLSSPAAVTNLLLYVPDTQLTSFYMSMSGALQMQDVVLPPPVQQAFLQQVFIRANLTTVSDNDLVFWITNILPPFVENITVQQVTTYFSIVQQRPCPISQQGVQLLNSSSSTFQPATQQQIYQLILGSLSGPAPLHCYGNQSFYAFLTSSFMSFQFPNLTTFLSLMPPGREPQLLASISPSDITSLLSRPGAVDDVSQLGLFFTHYPQTPQYLQTEPLLSVDLAREILFSVWPQILQVQNQSEVDQWFDYSLDQYLPLLTSAFISPSLMQNSSCLCFQKIVSVMANYNYSAVDFTQQDFYDSIVVFLNISSDSQPAKCYNTSIPALNSTAWFVHYISVFLSFLTLDDLQSFGSITPFIDNLQNLQLFGEVEVSDDVTQHYVDLLFETYPNFNAYYLPLKFLCLAPAGSFTQLTSVQLKNVSANIQETCSDIPEEVSAALASNLEVLTENSISALGQSCVGLSTAQISTSTGSVLLGALSLLSNITGWNLDQAMMIIQTLLASGVYKINSAASLEQLGSLIVGVQSSVITALSADVLLQTASSSAFVTNVASAPTIVQQSYVSQIISVNSSSDAVISNVPDLVSQQIPRSLLLSVTPSPASAQRINQKRWRHEQAVFIFESVASQFSNADTISYQVLQGFTSSRLQNFSTDKIMNLIRGCRRRANQTLILQESQLTCMYQYIKSSDLYAFSQYPPEVLLYYNYSVINSSVCRSYFSAVGTANFSVLSSTLSFKKQILLNSALQCLGVSGSSIARSQLDVLGNMCCFLSADYILNSDPSVLEKLKLCSTLNTAQSSAIETVLLQRNTSYGPSSSWNITTLQNLNMLMLYVSNNIWSKFTTTDKQTFLKTFLRDLRKNSAVPQKQVIYMMNQVNSVLRIRIKRSTDASCTAGQILQPQVFSDLFPFAYDLTQFNACLSANTLVGNLQAVTERVYDSSYQRIILDKLQQAYPSGVPDLVLQVLGSSSRIATANDIAGWNITRIDTLSALMDPANGDWDPSMVQLLVSKYLSVKGNTLGTNELNALGGTNLCALNTSVLSNITASSLQRATALSLTNCSSEKASVLFSIAVNAFSSATRANTISVSTYQLLQNYLGGADSSFIRGLVNSAVNMDVPTFMSLQQSVINGLNVSDVKSLLGVNVADLKTYESASVVQSWLRLQLQTELDTLQIGLTGGRSSITSTPAANTNTASSTASTTSSSSVSSTSSTTKAPSSATTANTTAAGSRVWPPVCLQLLLLLVVTMMTPQLLL